MAYIYVKDSEGFVVKKLASDLQADETIITKKEYETFSTSCCRLYKRRK